MTTNVTVAAQRQIDKDNRNREDEPSAGYLVSAPDEFTTQDSIAIGALATRTLWTKLAGDTVADDWSLLYVEARDSQLTLQLTLLDNADANPKILQLPLLPGLPFMVGSRLAWDIDTSGAYYVSQVDVVEALSATTAKVAFTFAR